MTVFAKYIGEELCVSFEAETQRTDFGVPRSPVWDEVDDDSVEITDLSILDVSVDIDDLPNDLQNKIMSLSQDLKFEDEQ